MLFDSGATMDIELDKKEYTVGEIIKGKLILDLKKDINARELRTVFYGEAIHNRIKTRNFKSRNESTTIRRISEQKIVLDGSKVYKAGKNEYPFEIKIGNIERINGRNEPDIVDLFKGTNSTENITWYVDCSLDIPLTLDISKRIKVNLRRS